MAKMENTLVPLFKITPDTFKNLADTVSNHNTNLDIIKL